MPIPIADCPILGDSQAFGGTMGTYNQATISPRKLFSETQETIPVTEETPTLFENALHVWRGVRFHRNLICSRFLLNCELPNKCQMLYECVCLKVRAVVGECASGRQVLRSDCSFSDDSAVLHWANIPCCFGRCETLIRASSR